SSPRRRARRWHRRCGPHPTAGRETTRDRKEGDGSMTTMRFRRVALVSCLAWATASAADQFADQLTCYQVKDPLELGGTVDLTSPRLGLAAGCRVSPAKLFCVPSAKSNVGVTDRRTGAAITPLPVSGPGPALGVLQADPGDRICYKVRCPTPAIGDQSVT